MLLSQFILLVALFNYILSFYVFKSNCKRPINLAFAIFTFLTGTWVLLNYFLQTTNSLLVLDTIYALAPFLIMSAFYFINLLGGKVPTKLPIVLLNSVALLSASVFAVLFYTSDEMIKSITDYSHYETGSLFNLYTVYVIVLFVILLGLLLSRYWQGDKKFKEQIKLFGLGITFVIVISSIVGFVLPSLGITKYNVLDSPSSIVLVLLTTYAIMKEQLFDLKTATVEIIAYFVVIVMGLILFSTQEIGFIIKVFLEILTIIAAYMLVKKNNQQLEYAGRIEKLNNKLERDKEELRDLDRMKDEFLQMATHELNTPITVIQGKLDMAIREDYVHLNKEQKDYFETVMTDTERLAHLSKDILNVARIDQHRLTINRSETDLDQLITSIVEGLQIKAKDKGITVKYNKPEKPLLKMMVDQNKISEVVTNLVNNAIKFTSKGGITVEAKDEGVNIVVSVKDTGVGIEKESQKHLFEKFYQVGRFDPNNPQEQQGSGLGLYISKNIIEIHGGKIWLESEKDNGSSFYFSLPKEHKEIKVENGKLHCNEDQVRVL